MRGFVRSGTPRDARPDLVPLAIEWSWESLLYAGQGTHARALGEASAALIDTDLEITTFEAHGPDRVQRQSDQTSPPRTSSEIDERLR